MTVFVYWDKANNIIEKVENVLAVISGSGNELTLKMPYGIKKYSKSRIEGFRVAAD